VNRNGKPLWNEREKDGKYCLNSNVRSAFFRLAKAAGIRRGLKYLRKTAASMLETQSEYAAYAPLYLGHSPRTIAAKHYIAPSQARFDDALAWLGKELGIE